ncbi:hypothetical protein FB451DRAFT_1216843 [Mycena latifolia]|nr:hypothetical protein FB451DRAFT_1216843 [Mycena latifolia]
MDAPIRGTFSTFAGFLFASIGFTLSVLSTFLRLLLPRQPTRSADVKFAISSRRRSMKRRHRNAPLTTTNSSISSLGSTTSSEVSCSPKSETKVSPPRMLEPPPRASTHNRVGSDSECAERPAFRNTVNHPRRRSESTPPSPSPWAFSHSERPESLKARRSSVDHTTDGESDLSPRDTASIHPTSLHLPHAPSLDALPAPSSRGRTNLSFIRRKIHKAPSASSGLVAAAHQTSPPHMDVPPIEKRASQLFAPLLHRKKSQHIQMTEAEAAKPRSQPSSPEEDDVYILEGRPSQESCHLAPRRSQTLRTQPYEAPYFFPAPGSEAAETYLPPRRRPVRSRTLHPDELGVGVGVSSARPLSGSSLYSVPNEG